MKINIYGVGRSGTKAVQLYLAYWLAKAYGTVRLNYEPYFWRSRSGPTSFEGIIHHLNSPQFVSDASTFSRRHKSYLQRLTEGDQPATVSKFIRANGRMQAIQELMQPDHSIFVIRDLRSVLESMLTQDFHFTEVGYRYFPYSYKAYWAEIKSFLWETESWLRPQLDKFSYDLVARNAFYWYAMNRYALDHLPSNTFLLQYKELDKLEGWMHENIDIKPEYPIREDIFNGKRLHKDFPLLDRERRNRFTLKQKMNEWLFYMMKERGTTLHSLLRSQTVGTVVYPSIPKDELPYVVHTKIQTHVEPSSLLDALQEAIDDQMQRLT